MNLANKILDLISIKMSVFRKKYPTINITYNPQEIKSIILGTDFQSIIDADVKVESFTIQYLDHTEGPVFRHQVWVNQKFISGLQLEPNYGSLQKMDGERGATTMNALTREMFPKGKYLEITHDMVIRHALGELLLKKIEEISLKITYEDINGLPLSFIETFVFNGYSFTRKDYSKIILANGESKIPISSPCICLSSDYMYVNITQSTTVNIDIEGIEIPNWGLNFPKGSKSKPKYFIEDKMMSYDQALELENIKGPSDPQRRLPSETDLINYVCDKLSDEKRYEEQTVHFFVWKEDFCTIRIPLAFAPTTGCLDMSRRMV